MTRLTIRLHFDDVRRLGPDKTALLGQIESTGSITRAAKAMGMSYRRAWLLLEATNLMFQIPVAKTAHGGVQGGGARLTPFERHVIDHFWAVETALRDVAEAHIAFFEAHFESTAT